MRKKTHNIIHAALLTSIGVAFVGCQSVPNVPAEDLSNGARGVRPAAGQAAGANGAPGAAGDSGVVAGAAQGAGAAEGAAGATTGAVAGAAGAAGAATGAAAGSGQAAAAVTPDAKVNGRVVDVNGAPVAGLEVNAYNGFKAVTGADGRFSMDVKAQANLRLDLSKEGYLNRQVAVSLAPGEVGDVAATVKPLDPKLTQVTAAAGANVVSSDGSAQLRIPPGALTKDGAVRLTWMDPMPSDKFPYAHGELPGPLFTRTLATGAESNELVNIPPIAFTNVVLNETDIAPGAQLELRMRVNPEALRLAGNDLDFNNPATLQQPCYDFDRGLGLWVNPATSRVEKDADGTAWFVYTMHGSGQTPNYYNLLQRVSQGGFVTGQQTVTWQENVTRWGQQLVTWSEPVTRSRTYNPGGGMTTVTWTEWVSRSRWDTISWTETVTRSRTDNLMGRNFTGRVRETSVNSSLNGQNLAGATVRHQQDFFGGTTKTSDGNGEFTIPMWHNTGSVSVNGAGYGRADSTRRGRKIRQATGFDLDVNTDSEVRLAPSGPDFTAAHHGQQFQVQYRIDGVLRNETVTFAPNRDWVFGRDTSDNVNNYALVSVSNDTFTYVPEGALPTSNLTVGDTASHGLRVYNRVANTGRVTERSSNSALNGQPLVGATVSHNADFFGATSKTTGAGGTFTIPFFHANTVVGGASYFNATAPGSFNMTVDTDSRLTLTLVTANPNEPLDLNLLAEQDFDIVYRIDGRTVTETVKFGPSRSFSFGRDAGDNMNNWELVSLNNGIYLYEPTAGVLPTSSLRPGASGSHNLRVRLVSAK